MEGVWLWDNLDFSKLWVGGWMEQEELWQGLAPRLGGTREGLPRCCLSQNLFTACSADSSPKEAASPARASQNIAAGMNSRGAWRQEGCERVSKNGAKEGMGL